MNDYETLGLEPGASPAEIERARNFLIRALHPDRFMGKPKLQAEAESRMKKVNAAYDRLQAQSSRPWVTPPPDPRAQAEQEQRDREWRERGQREQQERDRREQERVQRGREVQVEEERQEREHQEQAAQAAQQQASLGRRLGRWCTRHPMTAATAPIFLIVALALAP